MLLSPMDGHFRGLYARVGGKYGVSADEVRNTLLSLCDTMRRENKCFPATPEALLLAVFAVADRSKTVFPQKLPEK